MIVLIYRQKSRKNNNEHLNDTWSRCLRNCPNRSNQGPPSSLSSRRHVKSLGGFEPPWGIVTCGYLDISKFTTLLLLLEEQMLPMVTSCFIPLISSSSEIVSTFTASACNSYLGWKVDSVKKSDKICVRKTFDYSSWQEYPCLSFIVKTTFPFTIMITIISNQTKITKWGVRGLQSPPKNAASSYIFWQHGVCYCAPLISATGRC